MSTNRRYVHINGSTRDTFSAHDGLHQVCSSSSVSIVKFLDEMSQCSCGGETVWTPQMCISAFCRWCCFIRRWPLARTGAFYSWMWGSLHESASPSLMARSSCQKTPGCAQQMGVSRSAKPVSSNISGSFSHSIGKIKAELDGAVRCSTSCKFSHGAWPSYWRGSRAEWKRFQFISWSTRHLSPLATKIIRSLIEAAEMSFLSEVAGLTLNDRKPSAETESSQLDPFFLPFYHLQIGVKT